MKRFRDVLCAAIILVLLSPLFLVIACVIKLTSPGPVTFCQERTGYRGKSFVIFKFRTMQHKSGRLFDIVLPGDIRVTRIGKFLRSTYLDELPQFVNVLLGEMSLIGPRPQPPQTTSFLMALNPPYHLCWQVRPGMTGLGQLRGRLWMLDHIEEAIFAEIGYACGHSPKTDYQILFETCLVILKKQGI
ncbi:MAG: sugar transferase [Candidatus Moranbacteria bacterium]|nr:sugar transferase [Candidatus Moranbacteria bacterium]